jgi:hypothetical protein
MALQFHMLPDDVSFSRVQYKELSCPKTAFSGCYRTADRTHEEGTWRSVNESNDQDPSHDRVSDARGVTDIGPPPTWFGTDSSQNPPLREAGGGYTWNIPWNWRVGTGSAKVGTGEIIHRVTVRENGQMKIEKLGKSVEFSGPYVKP